MPMLILLLVFPRTLSSLLRIPGFHRAQVKVFVLSQADLPKKEVGTLSIPQTAVMVRYIKVE